MTSNLPELNSIVDEIAQLFSQHKLVPFIGAGLSRQHLGFAAAELAKEMAMAVNAPTEMQLSDVADVFSDSLGEAEFIAFLRKRLVVTELEEHKTPSHRLLVSLMQNLIYTTNQDNLFELTANQYGRSYRRVITVDDLSDAIPGEPLLIKFHGDTSVPESLVFGSRSYANRIAAEDHPLDIKLRADLLGKRLLFLGYSLKDENVAKIFNTVKRAFKGKMPTSYLVAFDDDPALSEAATQYQVKIITPSGLFPELSSNVEAFERFLQMVCDETRRRQVVTGIESVFLDVSINPHIVTDYEVKAAQHTIQSESFIIAVNAYRVTFDQANVPTYLQTQVTDLFVSLADRANAEENDELHALYGALFNLTLSPASTLTATAAIMTVCNRRKLTPGYDWASHFVCPALAEGMMPVAAAMATIMLQQRNEEITEKFRYLATSWFQGYENLGNDLKESVEIMIKVVWPNNKDDQSPLNRTTHFINQGPSFHQIVENINRASPKRLASPKD